MEKRNRRGREVLIGIVGGMIGGIIVAIGNWVAVEGYINVEVLEVATELLKDYPDGGSSDNIRNARVVLCKRLQGEACPTIQ